MRALINLTTALVAIAGCYSNAAPPARAPIAAASSPPAIARDYRASIADPVGFLPGDSQVVVVLDGDQLRKSSMWSLLEPRLRASTQAYASTCKLDPLASVSRVAVGMSNMKTAPTGVLVVNGASRTQFDECAKDMPAGSSVTDDGDVKILKAGGATVAAYAFVDESTLVVHLAPTATRSSLEKILASRSPLRRSPPFTALLAEIDTSAAVWGIVNDRSSVFDLGSATKPTSMWGWLVLDAGAALRLRVRFPDAQQPQQLVTQLQPQMGTVSSFFDRLDVSADDTDLVVVAEMDENRLRTMVNLFANIAGPPAATPTAPTLPPTP